MKNYSADANLAMIMASVMFSGRKNRKVTVRTPTPEQIARQEKIDERAAWNAAVEAKKAQKNQKPTEEGT